MTYFKFHRGANQIGGTCFELCSGEERILIDLGANLPDSDDESPISDKELIENVFGNNQKYNALLFTHYHGDHYGLYKEVPSEVPMYIGPVAKDILRIVTEYIDINAKKKGMPIIDAMKTYSSGELLDVDGVKDIKITPIVSDHSALDAYMFYIEVAGKKILYTGDFRDHGISSEQGEFWNKIKDNVPSDIDILVTEGTMLSRKEEANNNIVYTEKELGIEAGRRFKEHKYNFVMVSSTNLDSIMAMYHNTPDDMPFVVDFYQTRVISKAIQGKGADSELYKPKKMASGDYKPFYLLLKKGDDRIKGLKKENKAKHTNIAFYTAKVNNDYEPLKNGFVMLVRPNHCPDKIEKNRFEEALERFAEIDKDEVSIMYSMWKGYLKGPKEDKDITRFLDGHNINHLHVSGHAYPDTIKKLIEKTNPKVIIPMHTERAKSMRDMPEFAEYKDRIITMEDEMNEFDVETLEFR